MGKTGTLHNVAGQLCGTSYAVQSGPLKDTSVRATYTTHRASKAQGDGSLDEFRVVTTIPFNIL